MKRRKVGKRPLQVLTSLTAVARLCPRGRVSRTQLRGQNRSRQCPYCSASQGDFANPTSSRCEEFDEIVVDLVGRFLLQVVAGRERLRIDEVARVFLPHG